MDIHRERQARSSYLQDHPIKGWPALVSLFAIFSCIFYFSLVSADDTTLQGKERAVSEQTPCEGLSKAFTAPLSDIKGGERPMDQIDPVERRILEGLFTKPNTAFINKQAQITGSAAACGINVKDELKKLRRTAAESYPADSAESKKFVEVVECTVARYEKIGRTQSEQALNCDQTQSIFESIVQRGENPWRR